MSMYEYLNSRVCTGILGQKYVEQIEKNVCEGKTYWESHACLNFFPIGIFQAVAW